ncbi:MAG: isoprenylcysteine carboxylmethyltransferase family protein [Phycisphaerales bacterium]
MYACGFIANAFTPTTLDRLPGPHALPWPAAAAINTALLCIFAVQHSVMARPWFKARWTRLVPEPIERSTYVLFSSLALIAIFAFWQPLGGVVWHAQTPALRYALFGLLAAGLLLVLATTFMINHADLFGLRQVWLYARNRHYTHLPFKTPWLYSIVRHPLYAGWFISFWATPTMTAAHLLFAVATTVYILVAIRWEERDLIEFHGQAYITYRQRVPKLIPGTRARAAKVRGRAA